jgi:hypothetical protein
MSNKRKFSTVCNDCGKLIKRKNPGTENYCEICVQNKNTVQPFKKSYEVKFDSQGQKLSALDTVGEAFRHHGGSTLMLTEHIENGIDAIVDSIKLYNFKNFQGKIEITIDKPNSRIIVIDNGTGIMDPIWIMENPLKSRKTGISHQHGEFGRGLQGFRGFCNNLEYLTLRDSVSKNELSDSDIKPWLQTATKQGISGKCVQLKLSKDSVATEYAPKAESEFKRYTHNRTGTVAIFSNWLEGDFEELVKNREKLFERIQHHFRVVLEKNQVKMSLIYKGKPTNILPRSFSIDDDEMDLFELPDRKCIDPHTKQDFGTIQFKLYKAAPRYRHKYKSPFLLVGDRPLGNSVLLDMEDFADQSILKSPYLTGYVVANFLKPDSLRLSPKPGAEFRAFVVHLKASLSDLKPLLDEYEQGFRVVNKNEENQKLILQVQSFLKNQNVPLNLMDMGKVGQLLPGSSKGNEKEERLSSVPGGENKGLISADGTVETEILYKKDKHGRPQKKTRLKVKIAGTGKNSRDPKKDGQSSKTVYINPNLTSRDGRIRKRNFVGPGLDNYRGELDPNLSKWDGSKYLVLINELHGIYEKYEDQRKNSSQHKTEVYSPKQKSLIQESYLRHVIKNCAKDMDRDAKDRLFWELKYLFFLHK